MLTDRAAFAADKADVIEKTPRIVMLRADFETQSKLREWAKAEGFDLGWSHSGWPQGSWDFDFHVTIVASENAVRIEDGVRWIDPVTLTPTGFEVLGESTPALVIEQHATLAAIREFFVTTFGMKPTYPDFKPHVSLSYKWDGEPDIKQSAPALPPFPLVFDMLMVARFEPKAKAKDAAPAAFKLMHADDRSVIAGTRRTADGYLVTEARVARGGNIQDYYGSEIGEGEPGKLYKIWRPADEIFRADSLATFAHKPVTMGHPEIGVTPDTWRRDAIGHVGSEVVRDGEFVRVPLVVMDKGAIDKIEDGTREISMGYECDLVMEAGTTPDGRTYDGFQRNIRINHCAIVPAGRAGPQCRIGDSAKRINSEEGKTMAKSVTIDGKAIEVADNVAALLSDGKLGEALTMAHKAVSDALGELTKEKARADVAEKALADTKADLEKAKAQTPTADAVAKMAADLIAVCDAAKAIAPTIDTKGKAADVIKAEVVAHHFGDAAKGKDAAYVSAAFDLLSSKVADKADPVSLAISKAVSGVADKATKAADEYEKRMSSAWQTAAN